MESLKSLNKNWSLSFYSNLGICMLGILMLFAMATDSSETTVLWGNQGSERHFLIQVKYMMSTLLVILEEL